MAYLSLIPQKQPDERVNHMANVYVLGSLNMDTTYYVDRLPGEGETITSVSSQSAAGGKGLNQSAAAAWTGAATEIIGSVGKDGQAMIDALQRQHVGMRYLQRSGLPTGSAVILVDQQAKNLIVVNGGANRDVQRQEIPFAAGDWLMAQLETPVETVTDYFRQAKAHSAKTVLNLSPYQPVPEELLTLVDLLIVNEHEASELLGCRIGCRADACRAAGLLREKGIYSAVITLGGDGAVVIDGQRTEELEGVPVQAVDTQGAGDAFAGVLVGNCCLGLPLAESARTANQVAARCVTVAGSTIISLNTIQEG